jgi:hypothetical protein
MITKEKGLTSITAEAPASRTGIRLRNYAISVTQEITVSRVILIIAMVGATFLRLWQINAMGYNTDEAVYAGQAAAISGVPILEDIFPIFRAHPLLIQFILSIIYKFTFSDLIGRLLAVAFGLATVYLTYMLGMTLFGRLSGAFAALFIAFMPYHVTVSRQFLLDGPMVFFSTLTLYLLARYGKTQKLYWFYISAGSLGLTFLSKETGVILIGAVYFFLALSPDMHVRFRDLVIATVIVAVIISPVPITQALAGGSSTGRSYLLWELLRQPNHEWYFYLQVVPPAIGVLVILAALVYLAFKWKKYSWKEKLLFSWIIVPIVFFQLWPVKGYQYLLPIAPPLALLAGSLFAKIIVEDRREGSPEIRIGNATFPPIIAWILVGVVVLTISISSWMRIQPKTSSLFLAGTGGVPGGRETGLWIKDNVPLNAQFMTIGPSMANIIKFYGERIANGISVNSNPLQRNPSYDPILNPDLQIRNSQMQYLVWDSFSASRSSFFSDKLLGYANKYHGRIVHSETITVKDDQGNPVEQPVIVIFEVHP